MSNREIKFRAWDKNNNELLYVGASEWTETLGKMLDSFGDEDLMQYTGLKDKNGKEIFEGDIVKFDFDYSNKTFEGFVYFENACFFVNDNCKSGHLNLGHLIENKRNVQVIGNIYENPDLLTK